MNENLKDPNDLLSCSRTCTLFNDILSDTQFEWKFSLIFPKVYNFLPGSDILLCRVVCKPWKKIVDDFLQSDEYRPTLMHSLVQQPKQNKVFTKTLTNIDNGFFLNTFVRCKDPSPKFISEFLSHPFHQPNKNPFPARAVSLVFSLHEVNSIMHLFTTFGKYIYALDLYIKLWGDPTLIEVLQLVIDILQQTPNLKYFHIAGDIMMLCEENQGTLEAYMNENPAPKLDHLSIMELYTKNEFVNQALKMYYSSSTLTIFNLLDPLQRSTCFSVDLKKLCFSEPANKWLMVRDVLRHSIILPLECINAQLPIFPDFDDLLQCLLKYKATLRHVTLNFIGLSMDNILSMLGLWNCSFRNSFLQQMQVLREFSMVMDTVTCPVLLHTFVNRIVKMERTTDQQVGIRFTRMGSGMMNGFAIVMGKVRRRAASTIQQ